MHYNIKKKHGPTISSSFSSNIDIINKNNDLLHSIDILTIDKYSRLTLTKKVRKILSLDPEDKIIVYQEKYNKNIILHVQHKGNVVAGNWILIRGKSDSYIGDADMVKTNSIINIQGEKEENQYPRSHNENTFYSMPILLVDDEPDLLLTFDFFLINEGYKHIRKFSDSKDVLKHLLNLKDPTCYKLAIMDIRMPHINGIQLYQILKILNPSIKVVFLTALDAVNELTSIYPEIKSEDILRKPIDKDQFIKTVNNKINRIEI